MKKYVIGIDIGGTNLRISAIDEKLNVISPKKCSSLVICEGDSVLNLLNFIKDYIQSSNLHKEDVAAITIGIPGPVSKDKKVVYSVPNMVNSKGEHVFDNKNIVDPIENDLGIPVFIAKDTIFLLRYDIHSLNLDENDTVLGFYVGTGYGSAVYINNDFLDGKNGLGVEAGHMPMFRGSNVCGCGNIGCAESYASGSALVKIKNNLYPNTDLPDIFSKHKDDDVLKDFVDAVSIPVACGVNFFDPDYVVLSGGVLDMNDFPKDLLEFHIKDHSRKPFPSNNLVIKYSIPNNFAGSIGGALYAFDKLRKITDKKI